MPDDRDNWGGKALTTFEGSALAIYGYALGEAFKSEILPSIAYYLVPLVGEGDALAIAGAIVTTGEIAGAFSVGFAGVAILGAVGLMAAAAAGGKDISRGFDVLGMMTSPGTVFSMPIGLALSPADDPTLVSRVVGPGIDLAFGVLTAGNPELVKIAGLGYGITATQSDYQVDEANLQNWVSSLTNGSAGSLPGLPSPAPAPTPTPSPTPGLSPTASQSFGSQGYVFPYDGMILGSGDLGYESDEGSYSSSSSSFNGNGFNMTMTINSSGASQAPSPPPFNDAPPFDDGSPFNDAPPFDNHPFDNGGFDSSGFDNSGFDNSGFDNGEFDD